MLKYDEKYSLESRTGNMVEEMRKITHVTRGSFLHYSRCQGENGRYPRR